MRYIIISLVTLLISGCAAQLPNLLIKDSVIDDGISISKDRIFWLSPDIWLDNDGDGRPDDTPVVGASNKLFARIHNIGISEAKNVKVKFYANKANTYFSFKEEFLIGTNVIPVISKGESAITSITWENVKEPEFWALGVAMETAEVPITSTEPERASNLAYRSFWNVYAYAGKPIILKFKVQNPFLAKAIVNLTLDAQKLPTDWQAFLGKKSLTLLPKESKSVLLMATPAINGKDKEGIINVISMIEGKMVGGVSYRIMVRGDRRFEDCLETLLSLKNEE